MKAEVGGRAVTADMVYNPVGIREIGFSNPCYMSLVIAKIRTT